MILFSSPEKFIKNRYILFWWLIPGNAAWAHICAKDTLQDRPKSIGGLPIFITDDSPITDLPKFCVNMTCPQGESSYYNHSWWYLPSFISYFLAIILEPFLTLLLPGPLPLAPSSAVTFLGSIVLYNRLRADTHLQYAPVYQYQTVKSRTIKYYTEEARLRLCSRKLHWRRNFWHLKKIVEISLSSIRSVVFTRIHIKFLFVLLDMDISLVYPVQP